MTPETVRAVAEVLDGRLRGADLGGVRRPDPWTLGLELPGGLTLGFCWEPASLAIGLCDWKWPRGRPEEILSHHVQGTRIAAVTSLAGEPILRLELEGERARVLLWEAIGRSANMVLLGEGDEILWSGRLLRGPLRSGRTGERWVSPPARPSLDPPAGPLDGVTLLCDEGPHDLLSGLTERARRGALTRLDQRARALARKIEALAQDRREGEAWAALEPLAQALLATGNLGRRGEPERLVWDYTRDPPVEVPVALDPSKTVKENAEGLFKRAQKGKARLTLGNAMARAARAELETFPEQRAALERCSDLAVLIPEGARRSRTAPPQARRSLPPGVVAVPLPKGFAGYAGKSAAGNDAVSFKMGRGGDFWMHAEDYAGCHVVVRCPKGCETLPYDVEQAAALYAASHSGAPPGNRVAVVVSRCKFLRRVPGALGRVMMASHRTIFVDLPGGG